VDRGFVLTMGAGVLLAGITGCSQSTTPAQPPGGLPPNTAHVTIDGKDAGAVNDLRCAQTGSLYSIETGDNKAGVTAMIQFGDKITAQSVEIRNLAGFTGSYWENTVGKGEASLVGDTYRITGTAVGSANDAPNTKVSAPFEIRANC
jgi:ipoprotein LpqH